MATYSGTVTSGIVLTNPTTQNSTTITSTGYVTNTTPILYGDAVFGTSATFWTLVNYGTIKATATAGVGVDFAGGGTVLNAATSALIVGFNSGIRMVNTGTVINHGTIAGTTSAGSFCKVTELSSTACPAR